MTAPVLQIVICRTSQSLPLWGRWQPEGLTDEVQYTCFFYTRYGEMEGQDLIRPALRRATFPKGEGMGAVSTSAVNYSFQQ